MYQDPSPFTHGTEHTRQHGIETMKTRKQTYYHGANAVARPLEEERYDTHHAMLHIRQELAQECASLYLLHTFGLRLNQNLDIEEVSFEALHGTLEMLNAETGCLILLDEDRIPVQWICSDDNLKLGRTDIEAAIQDGIQGQALRQQRVIRLGDKRACEEPQLLDGRSLIVLPLQTSIGISGVLTMAHQRNQAFQAYPATLLTAIANTIELALQNAWRYQTLLDRDESRERIIGRLVHDIRSPLTATSASLDVIQRALNALPIDQTIQEFMTDSLSSGKRGLQDAIELTSDLLDMKKIQSGNYAVEREPVLLELLYDEVHRLLYSLAVKRQVIIRYQVQPRSLKAMADTRLLRRAMVNLAANALRFTPEGGTVTMKAEESQNSKDILIIVEDMGEGVPPEDRKRIFLPFTQARGENNRGTGLGLAFCREVALAHEGDIWVEEREGGGSRFCMVLPNDAEA